MDDRINDAEDTPLGPEPAVKQNQSNQAEDLRRRRSEVSRQAIRDAVNDLLRNEHPSTLSIPAVAAAAGVSVRTVYRYFPTKQDLLDDVAEIHQRRADEMVNGREDLYNDPGRYLEALWSDFESDLSAVKAQHQSELGGDIRRSRMHQTKEGLSIRLDKFFPGAPDEDRADLADLIMMTMSSSAFLDLHTRLGRSGPDAARLAWWAVRAMQKQFAADGGLGRSSEAPSSDASSATTAPTDPSTESE